MSDDDTYESAAAGAAKCKPMQCSALRKNGHVLIKGHPCKIVEMSTSKTGKHGHAKVHLVGIDIFTGNKLEENSPSTHNVEVPHVARHEFQVIDIGKDGFVDLMNDAGDLRSDLKVEEPQTSSSNDFKKLYELVQQIKSGDTNFEEWSKDGQIIIVTAVKSMDMEKVTDAKFKKE